MVPMTEVAVEAEKKLTPEEMRVEAVVFLARNRKKILADDELKEIFGPIYRVLDLLDEDSEFKKNLNTSYFETVLDDFLKRSNVALDPDQRMILVGSAKVMMLKYKEGDPKSLWWREMKEQSLEKTPEIFSSLDGQAGFWKILFEPKEKSETNGVAETQKMVTQFLSELAKNQSLFATEPLPHGLLPGAEGRKKYREDAIDYLRQVMRENPPLTGEGLQYNAFYKVLRGEYKYREFGKIEDLPIRIYKEDGDGKAFYRDIPAKDFGKIMGGELDVRDWVELSGYPNLEAEAPILGVSIGGSPKPDSRLYRHTHSGQSVMHFHYDLDKHRAEVAFNHANFDGVQGKEWVLAFAKVLEARNRDKLKFELEWAPPTQIHRQLEKAELEELVMSFVDDDKEIEMANYSAEMIFSFGLSDFSFRKEMPVEDYQRIETAVKVINEVWYKQLVEKMETIFNSDPGISEELKEFVLNRVGLSKMTVAKFVDLMARQYFGTAVSCAAPLKWEARLGYVLEQKMYEDVLSSVADFKKGKSEEVFGDVSEERLKENLKMAVEGMMKEYGAYYASDASALNIVKSGTERFRAPTEVVTGEVKEEALEGSEIVFMASHLGEGFEKNKDGSMVELAGFGSAFTTMMERLFAVAYSDILVKNEGKKTLRQNFRNRINPEIVERMQLTNRKRMEKAIDEVAEGIGEAVGKSPKEIADRLKASSGVLDKLIKLEDKHYKKNRDARKNMFLIAKGMLENVGFFKRYPGEDFFEEVQWLLIAGQWDLEKRFGEMCVKGADEIVVCLAGGA